MPNVTISPNMSLPIPVVGVDPGPDYASNINVALTTIDQHDHTAGNGVLISPAAININSDLPFGANNATNLRSARFAPNGSIISGPADKGCIFVAGVDLYYTDVSGNVVRMTQGGSVAGPFGTITGLPSGTASASYAAGTFVFQAMTNTPANVDGGSFIFRDYVANSFGLTLQPPSAMGADYTVTLPAPNALGQLGYLTYDTSNNIGSVSPDQVADSFTAAGANQIAATMDATGVGFIANTMNAGQADIIGSKMTSVGANAIGNVMTATGANHIGTVMTAPGADSVAFAMDLNGANSIKSKTTVSTGSSATVGNVAISGNISGTFGGGTVSLNSVTIATSGKPVMLYFMSTPGSTIASPSAISLATTGAVVAIIQVYNSTLGHAVGSYGFSTLSQGAAMVFMDAVGASTYSYNISMNVTGSGSYTATIQNYCLMAKEMV